MSSAGSDTGYLRVWAVDPSAEETEPAKPGRAARKSKMLIGAAESDISFFF